MCQVRNRSVQTGGSMGDRNLLATSLSFSGILSNWRASPEFYIVPKKYRAGPKPIETPVLFRPSAGRNPDWLIKATFHLTISMRGQRATGKIQRNNYNYHHESCEPSLTGETSWVPLIFTQASECQKSLSEK